MCVCPLAEILLSVNKWPNCIVEWFLKEETELCSRTIIAELESPLLIKPPSRWLFSTVAEHKVTLNCYGTGGITNVLPVVLKGAGELTGIGNCDVFNEAFDVPARVHGNTKVLSEVSGIKFPEIKSIFKAEENTMLIMNINNTLGVLNDLDERLDTLEVKNTDYKVWWHA